MKILLIILSAIVALHLLDTINHTIIEVARIKRLGNLDLKHCPFCGEPIDKEEYTPTADEDIFVQGGGIDEENSPKNDKKD